MLNAPQDKPKTSLRVRVFDKLQTYKTYYTTSVIEAELVESDHKHAADKTASASLQCPHFAILIQPCEAKRLLA